MGIIKIILWSILMLSVVGEEKSQDSWVELTALDEHSNVVENLGPAAIIYDHWTVLTVFQTSDREETENFLGKCVNMVEETCTTNLDLSLSPEARSIQSYHNKNLRFEQNCKSSVATIKSLANRIKRWGRKLDILTKSYRTRRAIEPVGALFRWAFGTLDSTDAAKYEQMFEQVERNNNVTLNMVHKQVTIMSSSMKEMLEPLRNLEKEHQTLKNVTINIGRSILELENATHITTAMQDLKISVITFLEAVTLKLEEILVIRQEEISTIDALINGQFHHNIVDLEMLRESYITMIKSRRSQYLPLAEPPFTLAKVDTFVLGEKIYIKISFPLPDQTIYQLKRIYPVIQKVDDEWSQILKIESGWVASDTKEDRYITWKDPSKDCMEIQWNGGRDIFLCESNGLVDSGTNVKCLAELAKNSRTRKTDCEAKLISTPTAWFVKMTNDNHWIYMVNDELELNADCRDKSEMIPLKIRGVGILKIKEPCDLTYGGSRIKYKRIFNSREKEITTVTNSANAPALPEWDKDWIETHKKESLGLEKIKISEHHEMSTAMEKAVVETEKLEADWEKEVAIRKNQKHLQQTETHGRISWSLMGLVTVLSGAGIFLLWRNYRQKAIMNTVVCGVEELADVFHRSTMEMSTLGRLASPAIEAE